MGESTSTERRTDHGQRSVLIVEDEQSIRDILLELFEVDGTATRAAGSLGEALKALAEQPYHLVLTDIRLGGKRDGGLQVMAAAGILAPDAVVVALTAYPDEDNRHASLRLGAMHFLEKPVPLATIAQLAARHGVRSAIYPAAEVEEGGEDDGHGGSSFT
jgi:DNA-binding NtrC family response regulator